MARQPTKPPVLGDRHADAALKYTSKELKELGVERAEDYLLIRELHREPKKVYPGMIVLADGTDWDPGSGAGYYGYRASSWVKLG